MQRITILPTTLIISGFLTLAILLAPMSAKAVTVNDLLTQVQSMMEQMAKMQVQLLELQKAGGVPAVVSTPAATTSGAPTGAVLGAKAFKFTHDLSIGADNDDIYKIQQLLKTDAEIYPEGTVTGFYGPKTENAIKNLQKRFGLKQVGVVGPATTALLERLLAEQKADGTFPADILDPTRPTGSVLGASTSNTNSNVPANIQALLAQIEALQNQKGNTTSSSNVSTNSSGIKYIEVAVDDGESNVKVKYDNGTIKDFWVYEDVVDDIIKAVAKEIGVSESVVKNLADFGKIGHSSQDDVQEITADVDIDGQETSVDVVYDGGDEDSFTVDESEYDNIIEAIADELDIKEADVKDIIEFDWNIRVKDIEKIDVTVENGEADVRVRLDGDDIKFTLDEDKESKIVKEIAHILDIDDSDVEDLLDIEFKD